MGWAHITNLDVLILDKLWYMSTIVELLTYFVVMHEIFSIEAVCTNGNSDKIQKDSDHRNIFVCFFVCLFVCLYVCLFVCLFLCLFVRVQLLVCLILE